MLTSSDGNRATRSLLAGGQIVLYALFRHTCVGALREVGLVLKSPVLWVE